MNRSRLQKGSALSIMLILAMGVGSLVTSFLGRTLVEKSRVSQRSAQTRAYRQALGQLELAKAIINSSGYAGGQNLAITTALASDPPVIPGTGVYVESAGPARWYRIVSTAEFAKGSAAVMAYMRDGTPYVAYNYYVEEQPLGISGKPRGKLHSNHSIEFYFANGFYDDFVSATDGFSFKSGATSANTTFAGGADPMSGTKDLLDLIDFNSLKTQAAVVTPKEQEAVITLQKTNVKLDLWSKPSIVAVPVVKTKKVQIGQTWTGVNTTVYIKQYQWVDVAKTRKVWVPVDPKSSGTDVGGGGTATGYWKTENYTVKEWKLVNVPNGTKVVFQWVPVYKEEKYTEMVNQTVAGTLQSTKTYAIKDQILFVQDNVKQISGDLNGKLTIVTDHDVMVTGNIRYKDTAGQYAFLNGLDTTQEYLPNPKFVRNHAFGVIAKGDIRYAASAPAIMEINGSLVSTAGMVGMQNIALDASGNPSLVGTASIKTSLRRFGSIMSSKRPVSTLLDGANQVVHGFTLGSSQYDRNLVLSLPPGYPSEEVVMWEPNMKSDGANFTAAGDGSYDTGLITKVTKMTSVKNIRGDVSKYNFNWRCDSCQ